MKSLKHGAPSNSPTNTNRADPTSPRRLYNHIRSNNLHTKIFYFPLHGYFSLLNSVGLSAACLAAPHSTQCVQMPPGGSPSSLLPKSGSGWKFCGHFDTDTPTEWPTNVRTYTVVRVNRPAIAVMTLVAEITHFQFPELFRTLRLRHQLSAFFTGIVVFLANLDRPHASERYRLPHVGEGLIILRSSLLPKMPVWADKVNIRSHGHILVSGLLSNH
ncbi:hypothetical protein PQU95_05095 [Vogesella sp. DC21W]|uniref:Uncharacterized protein n=1 Tax=Vogesella aquatica TaxID=2984206 RepID=A0ABT5IVJ6_9NEIS|nr:hypothetical protein [Vogesella aquatica]MDC7716587.1 hypothetical protein [Vogesella aquatica]